MIDPDWQDIETYRSDINGANDTAQSIFQARKIVRSLR